jgi:hypothetical protein
MSYYVLLATQQNCWPLNGGPRAAPTIHVYNLSIVVPPFKKREKDTYSETTLLPPSKLYQQAVCVHWHP